MNNEPAPTESTAQNSASPNLFKQGQFWIIICVVILLVGGGVYYFASRSNNSNPAVSLINTLAPSSAISGTIDLNGAPPSGSVITISAREVGNSNPGSYQVVQNALAPIDGATWSFGASKNKDYEVIASLNQNGKTLGQSNSVLVTAPANQVSLRINVISTPTTGSAVITGNITTNGYIPPGSTITVLGRKLGASKFTTIAQSLPAATSQVLTYANAINNQEYEVEGQLINQGKVIGSSNIIQVTAPAANETLQINSQAPAPASASNGAISGSVNINGPAPLNSSVVILSRPSGTTNFNVVVNGLNPSSGVNWSWSSAQAGKSYDLEAVLKQPQSNGTYTDVANSTVITATAPAQNIVFTLNSGFQLPSPNGAITLSCGIKAQNNTWSASVNFGTVQGTTTYWFQVGSSNGGSDLVNTNQAASNNPNQTVNVTLNDSVTYFARYAIAASTNPTYTQFSPFSNTQTISCPN